MKLIPLRDNVLCQPLPAKQFKIGSILVPEAAQAPMVEAVITAVGSGKLNRDGAVVPLVVSENETVLIPRKKCDFIAFGNEELILVREEDIAAVWR